MDRWDPRHLALPPGTTASALKPRNSRRVASVPGRFVKGPIPVPWLLQARERGITAYHVGLCLWYLRGLRQSDSFIVSNVTMQEWGVSADAKARALRALEKAGLIGVERSGRRNPRVTLVVDHAGGGDATASS